MRTRHPLTNLLTIRFIIIVVVATILGCTQSPSQGSPSGTVEPSPTPTWEQTCYVDPECYLQTSTQELKTLFGSRRWTLTAKQGPIGETIYSALAETEDVLVMWVDHQGVKFVLMSTGLTPAFVQNDVFIEATLRQIIGEVIPQPPFIPSDQAFPILNNWWLRYQEPGAARNTKGWISNDVSIRTGWLEGVSVSATFMPAPPSTGNEN